MSTIVILSKFIALLFSMMVTPEENIRLLCWLGCFYFKVHKLKFQTLCQSALTCKSRKFGKMQQTAKVRIKQTTEMLLQINRAKKLIWPSETSLSISEKHTIAIFSSVFSIDPKQQLKQYSTNNVKNKLFRWCLPVSGNNILVTTRQRKSDGVIFGDRELVGEDYVRMVWT